MWAARTGGIIPDIILQLSHIPDLKSISTWPDEEDLGDPLWLTNPDHFTLAEQANLGLPTRVLEHRLLALDDDIWITENTLWFFLYFLGMDWVIIG